MTIYVLKHMDILQRMPFLAQDAVFKRLSEIAEVSSMTKEERRQYYESLKHFQENEDRRYAARTNRQVHRPDGWRNSGTVNEMFYLRTKKNRNCFGSSDFCLYLCTVVSVETTVPCRFRHGCR